MCYKYQQISLFSIRIYMYLHESEIYEMLRDFKYPDLLGGGTHPLLACVRGVNVGSGF